MCDRWRRYEELIKSGEEDQLMKMIRRREDMNEANGPQGKTLVHLAAEHGNVSLLQSLAAREAHLHVQTRATKDTPAHLAARHGHFKVLRVLGEYGQSLGSQRPDGDAPIHFACMYGHEDCVRVLCAFAHTQHSEAEDTNMDATCPLDPDGIVPVNLNVVNNNGSLPSHLAALKGHVTILAILKDAGADLNIANCGDNLTPLDWAMKNNQKEAVAYLQSLGYQQTPPPPPAPAPAPPIEKAKAKKGKKGKKKK